jgi:hypothetical protein
MFIFDSKEFLGNTIFYKWEIVYNDNTIGTMNLILRPELEQEVYHNHPDFKYEFYYGVSAIAYFYREKIHNVTEDDITQIARDFVSLANNRLLDVDEVYSNLYVVEKSYDDTIRNSNFFNPYFYSNPDLRY